MHQLISVPYADLLPPELVVASLSNLAAPDLLRCSRVCHRFNRIISESILLQYQIALGRVGAIDNPSSTLSTAKKLERLLTQERAWLNLNPTRRDTIPIPRRFGSFDLCGGVLVGAKTPDSLDNDDSDYEASDYDGDDALGACELLGMQLPSVIAGEVDVRTWSRNVGFPVYGLGIDASQDLAVVIQARTHPDHPFLIHIMTLSSFTSHSLAVQSVLEQHPGPSVSQVSVRCFGNLIGVMFHSFDTETFQQSLIIYDWKTGVAKACVDSVKEERFFDDFGFLAPNIIILPSRRPFPATLEVYMFELEVARRSSRLSKGSIPSAVRIASFWLPEMNLPLEVSVNTICCNAEIPPLLSVSAAPPRSDPESDAKPAPQVSPFQLDPASALLSFSFMVCHGHSAVSTVPLHERFTLVIQRKAFVNRVHEVLRQAKGRWVGTAWRTVLLPWTNWGPHISRWITMKHLSWACFVSGTRIVLSPTSRDEDSRCHLRILDFNPYVVAQESEKRRRKELRQRTPEYCEESAIAERWKVGGKSAMRQWDDEEAPAGPSSQSSDTSEESAVSVKLVDFPGYIPDSKLWLHKVESQLPYRQVTTKESFAFANVVIDEERIGGIMVNDHGDLTDVQMLTM